MPRSADGFCTIDAALDELRAGRMIVLVDDEHRENEGDLVMAAEAMTPAAINFMIRQACGRLCVSFSRPHADRLGLDLLPGVHLDPTATPPKELLRDVAWRVVRIESDLHPVSAHTGGQGGQGGPNMPPAPPPGSARSKKRWTTSAPAA